MSANKQEVSVTSPAKRTREESEKDVDATTEEDTTDGEMTVEMHHKGGRSFHHAHHGGSHIESRFAPPDVTHRDFQFQVLTSQPYSTLGIGAGDIVGNLLGPTGTIYNLTTISPNGTSIR